MQEAISKLTTLGAFPSEAASFLDITARLDILQEVIPPLTLDEASAMCHVLGPDDCFGLAWTIIHLIETAPGWGPAHIPSGSSPLLPILRERCSNQ